MKYFNLVLATITSLTSNILGLFVCVVWLYGCVLLQGWSKLLAFFIIPPFYAVVEHLAIMWGLT